MWFFRPHPTALLNLQDGCDEIRRGVEPQVEHPLVRSGCTVRFFPVGGVIGWQEYGYVAEMCEAQECGLPSFGAKMADPRHIFELASHFEVASHLPAADLELGLAWRAVQDAVHIPQLEVSDCLDWLETGQRVYKRSRLVDPDNFDAWVVFPYGFYGRLADHLAANAD